MGAIPFHLTLFFLFFSSSSVILVSGRRTTKTPPRASLNEAEDKFLNAQTSIIQIRATEVFGDNLEDLKTHLIKLQNEVEQLIESSKTRTVESEACDIIMKNMKNSYNTFDDQLRRLQFEFEKHSEIENRTTLFKDIVADIRNSRYKLADEKFMELNDHSMIPKIVHEVYAHSEANFGLILNFAVEVSDSANFFTVLKTLYEEMLANHHIIPQKLIILAQAFDKEDADYNDTDVKFITELVSQIKTTTTDMLFKSLKFGDFSTNDDIHNLLVQLYDFSAKLSDEVMQLLVEQAYGNIESRTILAQLFLQCNTPQAASGIITLFGKIKNMGLLNDSLLVMDIASNLSELQKRKDFIDLRAEWRKAMANTVESIPKCARDLFFEPSVCLWNKAWQVYAFAANETFNFDKERRRILTTSSERIPKGGVWIPEKRGDDILLRNKEYTNEYLYVAEIDYNHEIRYVFSWIPGHNKDIQSAFKIELLDNDTCFIRSSKFNEYIYASDVKYKKNDIYNYVFSWKKGNVGDVETEFVWQIKGC